MSIKQLFCKHMYVFYRNIYGEEIIASGWKRSIDICIKCEKLKYYNHLQLKGENKMNKHIPTKSYNDTMTGSSIPVEHINMYTNAYPKHKEDANVERFNKVASELLDLYIQKNRDYGDSFDISLDEDGLLVAKIRLGDKYNRFSSLIKKKHQEIAEESKRDTLIDMANYAIMTVMWMDAKEELQRQELIKKHKAMTSSIASAPSRTTPSLLASIGADMDGDIVRVYADGAPVPPGADTDGDVVHDLYVGPDMRNPHVIDNIAMDLKGNMFKLNPDTGKFVKVEDVNTQFNEIELRKVGLK